jgi:hypothetical protein
MCEREEEKYAEKEEFHNFAVLTKYNQEKKAQEVILVMYLNLRAGSGFSAACRWVHVAPWMVTGVAADCGNADIVRRKWKIC